VGSSDARERAAMARVWGTRIFDPPEPSEEGRRVASLGGGLNDNLRRGEEMVRRVATAGGGMGKRAGGGWDAGEVVEVVGLFLDLRIWRIAGA
jgi:hypothetical protein